MTAGQRSRSGGLAHIGSSGPSLPETIAELWSYRELIYFLAWRDVRVRYKQAVLGFAWAVLRPLVLMGVFTFVFSHVAGTDTEGVPYAAFSFTGLAVWTYFSTALVNASESLVASSNLVSKTYFPRLALPLAALLAQVPDLLIGLVILAVVMVVAGVGIGPAALVFPVILLALLVVTVAASIGISAVNVSYRDVKYAVPFVIQLGLFITPIGWSAAGKSSSLRLLLGLNPMTAVIESARWSLVGAAAPSLASLATSAVVCVLMLLVGVWYFRRTESTFADVI